MREKKFQLHVSGLLQLAKCGVAFEKRYILGERSPSGVSAAIGTAVDRSITRNLQSKIDSGQLLDREEVQDIARDALLKEWRSNDIEASPEDEDEGVEFSRDTALDRSVTMAGFHYDVRAPHLNPTHVQRSWVLDIEGLPEQLAGTIDIQEGLKKITDTKTSAKSPKKDMADTSLQLTTYAVAVNAIDKGIPASVGLDYIVMTPKRGDTKFVPLDSIRSADDFPPLLNRIYQAHQQIESGIFTPASPDAWWCSRKYCAFFANCKYAVRPVSVAAVAQSAA